MPLTDQDLHSLIRASAHKVIGYADIQNAKPTRSPIKGNENTNETLSRHRVDGKSEVRNETVKTQDGSDASDVSDVLTQAINESIDIQPLAYGSAKIL